MVREPSRAAVLVADDEPLTRWALRQTLERAHLEVTLASSRHEVCHLLESGHFHVAVVANELGHVPMNDVLEALAKAGQGQGLVILYDGDSAEEFAQAFPAATLVQKPFGLEALTSAIEAFLAAKVKAR
jgi:DNA-binding NtrC family response regulator